jgi:hypothetical protein
MYNYVLQFILVVGTFFQNMGHGVMEEEVKTCRPNSLVTESVD